MQESWARTALHVQKTAVPMWLEGKEGITSDNGRRCGQRGNPVKDHIVLSLVGCDSNFTVGYEGDRWESTGCLKVHLIILQIKIKEGKKLSVQKIGMLKQKTCPLPQLVLEILPVLCYKLWGFLMPKLFVT